MYDITRSLGNFVCFCDFSGCYRGRLFLLASPAVLSPLKFGFLKFLPVKGSALPNEIDDKVRGAVERGSGATLQLEAHVVSVVIGHFDHVAYA